MPGAILKLKNQGLPLIEAIEIILNIQNKLDKIFYKIGISVNEKFLKVLKKNTGFETISKINDILTGERKLLDGLPKDFTISDLIYFKYAPTASMDVERI